MASALLIAVLVSCITTLQCFNEKGEVPTSMFLTRDTNVTVFEGTNAVLPCAVQHPGTSQVLWRQTSSPDPLTIGLMTFTSDARISVHHKKLSPEWNLHIRHVSTKDGGLYTCQILNKSGQRHDVLLTVQVSQRRRVKNIKISGPSYVEKGNALRLVCNATGDGYPPDGIDWFKDGHKITQDDRLHIQIVMSIVERTIISSLYIKRAKMTDAGTYVCRTSDLQITSTKVVILNTVNATTVGPTPPSSGTVERKDIECTAGTMDIHIPRSLLPTHNVTLRDPTCVVPSNGTHLVISISFNQCGTTVSFSNDTVVFSNELVATVIQASHPSSIVDYGLSKDDQRVSLECVYKRRSSVELNYMPMMRAAHFYEKRYGNLDFELKHYSDEQFTTEIANTDIPTGVNLNSEIFIDLVVDQHQTKDIGIYVPSCFATPTPSPTDPLFYPLIKSSCPAQADVRRFTAPDINEFRFSFLAFKFTRAPLQKIHASMPAVPMVYIHCQVSACPRGNCTSSCNSANGGRMKRAALGDSSHLISSGPFYLKTDESTTGYSSIVVAVTMSVAVAATVVAMAAIVAWRRSAAKLSAYQSLRMNMDS